MGLAAGEIETLGLPTEDDSTNVHGNARKSGDDVGGQTRCFLHPLEFVPVTDGGKSLVQTCLSESGPESTK